MKNDKVYLFIEEYNCDYEHECRVNVYANKEDAYKALAETKERELKESWISRHNEDDLEIGADEYDIFDIYLPGYASRYETFLKVEEREIR